jgi:hypothetical protein
MGWGLGAWTDLIRRHGPAPFTSAPLFIHDGPGEAPH